MREVIDKHFSQPVPPVTIARTDFAGYEDETLAWMLHRGAPEIVNELAQGWGIVGIALSERAHDMEIEFRRMKPSWTGASARHYEQSVRSLISAIEKVGRMAGAVSEIMHGTASALTQARTMYAPPEGFQPIEGRPRVWHHETRADIASKVDERYGNEWHDPDRGDVDRPGRHLRVERPTHHGGHEDGGGRSHR